MVLNARPRWTVGSAIGKFTTQNPAVYHPQADKISISLPGPLPVRSSFAGIQPFALPNIALRVRVLKGCRARPCARAAERARACRRAPGSAMSAVHGVPPWPAQVAGGAAAGRLGPSWPAWQAGQLPPSAAPGLTRTPISQQSLQQLANACAGFRPPPGGPRVLREQKQRCYLLPHVVQGLCELSVMLGADRTTALSDFRPGRHHTQGDQVLRPPFLRERRECARVCARLAPVDCMQLAP